MKSKALLTKKLALAKISESNEYPPWDAVIPEKSYLRKKCKWFVKGFEATASLPEGGQLLHALTPEEFHFIVANIIAEGLGLTDPEINYILELRRLVRQLKQQLENAPPNPDTPVSQLTIPPQKLVEKKLIDPQAGMIADSSDQIWGFDP